MCLDDMNLIAREPSCKTQSGSRQTPPRAGAEGKGADAKFTHLSL
jgi:hypothetical protein